MIRSNLLTISPSFLRYACAVVVCSLGTLMQSSAQDLIINEAYNSSANDEWIELLVVKDSLDIRGWGIKDFTSSGNPNSPTTFTTNNLWSNLRAGTIIVVGRPENVFSEDLDPSDNLIVVKTDNVTYMTSPTSTFSLAGSSDAIEILNASSAHVIGVSWGTNNAASLPSPKVHFPGTSSSNTAIAFNGNAVDSAVSVARWTINSASPTPGLGNSASNSAWIASLRSRLDGSGKAIISPGTMDGGMSATVTVTYLRDTAVAVTDLRVIVPGSFQWSHDTADVAIGGLSSAMTIDGDTVTLGSIAFDADSATIAFQSMTAPDTSGSYPFIVQSKAVASFETAGSPPVILVFGIPLAIADIKTNNATGVSTMIGQLVTVRGIVTAAGEFGGPSFIQDNSGGLSVFGSSFTSQVADGEEVIVSGTVTQFNGLNQIENPVLRSMVSNGNSVEPLLVTTSQIANDGVGGVEEFEGRLVELRGVTVTDLSDNPISQWTVTGSGTNYRLHDETGFVEVRIDNNVDFGNTPAPQSVFDIVGIVGQFKSAQPLIGGYQLMPRGGTDISAKGPIFLTVPQETSITPTSFVVTWTTVDSGSTFLRYGATPAYELGVVGNGGLTKAHSVTLTSLSPATIYSVQAFSVAGADTSTAGRLVVSTSSDGSTGAMNVYFNKSIDPSVAVGDTASGNVDLVARVIGRINAARYSIDLCLYSLSGLAGANVAAALVTAHHRQVDVRVIGEKDNQGTAPWSTLKNDGIPVIDDGYDATNAGVGIMHNKFFVFDYRGGAADSIWIWTGSCNMTDPGTVNDLQNSIELQDKALAGAYTLEFNEMWGSDSDTPNASLSRFGARKTDNTPHRFVIGGTNVELYFSPSDRVTSHIISTLEKASSSINVGMLTFTRSDISGAIKTKHDAGVSVHGILDNGTDLGSQYSFFISNGIDFLIDVNPGQFHHKYAIVDADRKNLDQYVITGSHNWSSAAENSNNENTLIIQGNRIANLYLQEFKARYIESGGLGSIIVETGPAGNAFPGDFALSQNYPNPFNPATKIEFRVPSYGRITLMVFDMLGREVSTLVDDERAPGAYTVTWDASRMPTGVYFCRMTAGAFVQTRKIVLVK